MPPAQMVPQWLKRLLCPRERRQVTVRLARLA